MLTISEGGGRTSFALTAVVEGGADRRRLEGRPAGRRTVDVGGCGRLLDLSAATVSER